MDLKIVEKKENPLLKREEIEFEINSAVKTPSLRELREQIAAQTGVKKELVVVRTVKQAFGEHRAVGTARAYSEEEIMKKAEQKYVLARNEGKKQETAEEKIEEIKGKEKDEKAEDSKKEEKEEKPEKNKDKKEEENK